MKQKITLEIDNQTGVEFEEVTEWRLVRKGDFYVLLDEEGEGLAPNILKATVNGCFYAPVLTPKIDHELEEAKRRFASGWFLWDGRETVFKTDSIERDTKGYGKLMITSDIGKTYMLDDCIPIILPTWRCCERDKPDVVPEKLYYVRHKKNHEYKNTVRFNGQWWTRNGGYLHLTLNDYEWLDEGGK